MKTENNPAFTKRVYQDFNPVSRHRKTRIIYEPNRLMRQVHAKFLKEFGGFLPRGLPITACIPGASPKMNLEPHRRNRYFYLTDIHSAYSGVNIYRLASLLCSLRPDLKLFRGDKLPHEPLDLFRAEDGMVSFLRSYFFAEEGGLATGGPAAPFLFNIYCANFLDVPLMELCRKWELTYTRYLDDLTFSAADGNPIGDKKREAIRAVVISAGFEISHRKSQVLDLKKGTISITGIGLEYGGRLFMPRAYTNTLRGALYRVVRRRSDDDERVRVRGMYSAFLSLIDLRSANCTEKKIIELAGRAFPPKPKKPGYTPKTSSRRKRRRQLE